MRAAPAPDAAKMQLQKIAQCFRGAQKLALRMPQDAIRAAARYVQYFTAFVAMRFDVAVFVTDAMLSPI